LGFFDNNIANILQHIAVVLEMSAFAMIIFDLKGHRKDQAMSPLRMVTQGNLSGIKDRSKWFYIGIAIAGVAILMELYQLGCIYFAVTNA